MKFEPFTLELEINTLDELKNLYNRLNIHIYSVEKAFKEKYNPEEWKEVKYWNGSNFEHFCAVSKLLEKYEKETQL